LKEKAAFEKDAGLFLEIEGCPGKFRTDGNPSQVAVN
jgi:hypothetical protein